MLILSNIFIKFILVVTTFEGHIGRKHRQLNIINNIAQHLQIILCNIVRPSNFRDI